MLKELLARVQQGHRTSGYPSTEPTLPDRMRGGPALDPSRCLDGCRACVEVCPTDAMNVDEQGLSINHAIASTALAMLTKLLITKDLQHHCAYVCIDSGTTFSYNSPCILTGYLHDGVCLSGGDN